MERALRDQSQVDYFRKGKFQNKKWGAPGFAKTVQSGFSSHPSYNYVLLQLRKQCFQIVNWRGGILADMA